MDDHLAEALEKLEPGESFSITRIVDGCEGQGDRRAQYLAAISDKWIVGARTAPIDDKLIDACGGSMSGAVAVTIEKLIAIRRREADEYRKGNYRYTVGYRRLKKGEVIQDGDEIDCCADQWRDDAVWEPVNPANIGDAAPDPQHPAHRQYRRPVGSVIIEKMTDLHNSDQTCDD